ncbi:hypothetical protein P153DRAFT_308411 [Dothidotthia symphoricarpi CBS 119687]|uniref:Uncharacterized protein n=1 Tax=Dothidotthia symphoricarpi CBS 119687 TaxID=1392245 RepID=A0A6A6AQQ3_9PLEO|nr:uncharacterized protein P153DRAFT_308411 [Dothidotthia symphoricarpi CBS 119687]KAF2133498.1 hypothetical protein P153DRAFT_308411 [Dothidotthia symphoricarpi CBS 119687]
MHTPPVMEGKSITYATSKDWLDILKNRSKVRMHELIERLGLRAKWSSNKRGKTNFESALVRDLVSHMSDVVSTLPKESDDLIKTMSEENSLKKQIDELLEVHGNKIWGKVGEREHLLTANETGLGEGVYPKDLYFENKEDKQLIHMLLHWWIGLKGCNVILARERLEREKKKKEEDRKARAEAELSGQSTNGETLARTSFVPLVPNVLQADKASYGSAMSTPPESGESPPADYHDQDGPGFTYVSGTNQSQGVQQPQNIVEGIWSRALAGSQTVDHDARSQQHIAIAQQQVDVDRKVSHELAKIATSFRSDDTVVEDMPQQRNSVPYRGLDYDSLRALRSYIYGEEGSAQWDEEVLLNRLEQMWRDGVRADFDKIVDNIPVFIARERAFLTWIELKRHMAALERADKRWRTEGHSAPEITRRIQQHKTLMGCTQSILANFEDIGKGFGLGTDIVVDKDELLRQSFAVLAGEKYAVEMMWKGVEFTAVVQWLCTHLQTFQSEEEEEGREMLWYAG